MDQEQKKAQLVEIVKTLRIYEKWMLEGLVQEDYEWRPSGGSGRTIQSLVRHIINAEIYWLKHLGDDTYNYLSRKNTINDMSLTFKELEHHLISLLNNASDDDLKITNPIFDDDKLETPGSLAWMVIRTSLHAVHHFGQIAHIRFSMEKPPDPEERKVSWGEAMDVIAKAMLF